MSGKSLLKFLISCFVMVLSSGVQAQIVDFTDDFDKSKIGYQQQFDDLPAECKAKLANKESVIDPVIECYDKKGVKYLLSLRKRNKLVKDSIDISKPMILHLMVDDQEIPLKFYMFVSFLWNHDHLYESNRQEMSVKGKRFLRKVYEYQRRTETGMPVSNSFWGLYPDDNLKYLYPIGPFAK
ncbi:MAG: hypothetical protein UH850_15705 [Paludibacteraceae bacterium]|nr:hypothetical protein [Paludibacteraceae bacterium]